MHSPAVASGAIVKTSVVMTSRTAVSFEERPWRTIRRA